MENATVRVSAAGWLMIKKPEGSNWRGGWMPVFKLTDEQLQAVQFLDTVAANKKAA